MAADNLKGSTLLLRLQNGPACPQARTGRNQHTPGTAGPEGSQNTTHQSFYASLQAQSSFITWWRSSKQTTATKTPLGSFCSGLNHHRLKSLHGDSDRPGPEAALLWAYCSRAALGHQCCPQAVGIKGPWTRLTSHCPQATNSPACWSSGSLPDLSGRVSLQGHKA